MADDEIVIIVDENDNETGTVSRAEMRKKKLIHRASYVLVLNKSGEVFVQKRTANKDIYPGYYDVAAGGVVLAGETYENSAKRELYEELGIDAPLKFLFENFYSDENNKVWGHVFSCFHAGPFFLQEDEIDSGEFVGVYDIISKDTNKKYTPDGIEIIKKILSREPLNAYLIGE